MPFSTRRGFLILLFLIQLLNHAVQAQAIPEWQDPQVISINTEKPRADFFPYPTEKTALAMDKKARSYSL
jgi:beta-galactosidase